MRAVKATRCTAEFNLLPRCCGLIGVVFAAWLAVSMVCCPMIVAGDELADGFCQPPESTKPWCYWYWISDNLSREGITRDLEAMARVGIGEAFIGNIFLKDVPAGDVKALSEPWWEMVEHAIREAGRVGVNIGMFNCPGWSQSGGPWIQPDQAMRYLASSEIGVQGPMQFTGKLPVPATPFQDVAVLAFPAPQHDSDTLASLSPRITCTPAVESAQHLIDGDLDTALAFPANKQPLVIDIELDQPLTARHLSLIPSASAWAAQCELYAADRDGDFREIKSFGFDRSNMAVGVGPMPRGPVTVSFPATTANRFRLILRNLRGQPALAEIQLSGAARLESYIEKQLGKMHPTPLPMWDAYLWPSSPEPDRQDLSIRPDDVRNLTDHLAPDGTLQWDVPAGRWVIQRIGMTPTGTRNAPASPEAEGLEVDKMNRQAAEAHFDAFIGKVLQRMPAADRRAFTRVVADSYEMGSQNWTDGFAETFRARYDYDPLPWLAVLQGRIVGSADQSDRFLWDLRRLVAERIGTEYVGGLRDLCHRHGLQLWLENYGHWGFPGEFLQYGSQSDRIGGEFWVTGSLGSIECRAASSCANIYGQPVVSAEAFTGGPPFRNAPSALKARGDWAFSEGINHFVLHVTIHQPWEDRFPGMNAWFGTEFNRHNTWFGHSRAWGDYVRRCCWMLQQGTRVADVAYFIGEDTPKMTGTRVPELPDGHDFDFINADVIEDKLTVENGLLKLPHGTTYRVLVLPPQTTMRPALLRKIRDLVAAGATVIGPLPSRSPSMEDYPECDAEIQRLVSKMGQAPGIHDPEPVPFSEQLRTGEKRVIADQDLRDVFATLNLGRDFDSSVPLRFTHRRSADADIYFVANPEAEPVTAVASFRISNKAPELWRPDTGGIERPAVYDVGPGTVSLPLHLGPHGSVFVVFRETAAADPDRIVSVRRNGQPLLSTVLTKRTSPAEDPESAGTFTLAAWVKPADDTTLHEETNQGVRGLSDKRNDAIFPPHGDTLSSAGNHAGAGLAIGRNGICVFEHGASYFAPVLVHAVALTDWTHVAVVYRDGQPSLFLNGAFVHRGLRSTRIVHPGSPASAGGAPFRGVLGKVREFPRALDVAEIATLAKTTPRPVGRQPSVAIELARVDDGPVSALIWQAGDYVLKSADGRTQMLQVAELPEPLEITGPWTVAFDPQGGGPESITLEALSDWTQHPDPAVKYYSGKATYRSEFTLPASLGDRRLYLDLGEVRDLAAIRVNGEELGVLWIAPWQIEITDAVRAGQRKRLKKGAGTIVEPVPFFSRQNVLEIDVVNVWNNRLVGDANLPPEKRRTFLAAPTVKQDSPLLPAGLLGPVILKTAETKEVR
jgi:hypothetical protein